jgi:hypothetical protein
MGWVMLAGTVISALAQNGQAQNKARDEENIAAEKDDAAKQQADLIRKAARAQRGASQAAFVSSGVDTSAGTPLKIDDRINQDSEYDAYNALLSGRRQSRAYMQQASETRTQGAIDAGSTVLSAYGNYRKSGWKTG